MSPLGGALAWWLGCAVVGDVACGCASSERATHPAPPHPPSTASAPSPSAAPSAPPPPSASGAETPVVLALEGAGLVGVSTEGVVPLFSTRESLVGLGAARDGTVFASFYEVGTVRLHDGAVTRLGPKRFVSLVGASLDDAWGVTDDIDWEVDHFDGSRWVADATRLGFPGVYSDNKLSAVALDAGDRLWIACSNGVYARSASGWARIAPPSNGGDASAYEVFAMGRGVVARYPSGTFLRAGDGWASVAWPAETTLAATDGIGLAVGRTNGPSMVVGAPGGRTRVVDPGAFPREVAIDGSGRVWIATDAALSAIDADGRVLGAWGPGQLEGVTGRVVAIAVAGPGPRRLPPPRRARRVNLSGRVTIYRSRAPLANRPVDLCLVREGDGCAAGSFRRSTTTSADGSFHFDDVPEGDYDVLPAAPRDLDDCKTPFDVDPGAHVSLARDCPGAGTCAIAPIVVCLPFEMPPR